MGDRDPTYFQYYAQYVHQQNMLQDTSRTQAYYTAIISHPEHFREKAVIDLGAGSGILSYFAVQAGASHVFSVEASQMAKKMQKLVESSVQYQGKITVVPHKIEDIADLPMVDTLISEPIGVFLVHERMIESYIYARDHFLRPGGTMVPSSGSIYVVPFTDQVLYNQTMQKARFWESSNFYGVDFSCLYQDAKKEIFGQPVVGPFDQRQIMAPSCSYSINFEQVTNEELKEFTIPFKWASFYTGIVHGLGSWFDINLAGTILSTSPSSERTHWHQVRLLLSDPLAVNCGQIIEGYLTFKVNDMRSYDLSLVMHCGDIIRRGEYRLNEQNYYFDTFVPEGNPEMIALYEGQN